MRSSILFVVFLLLIYSVRSQNVGIGTNTPNPKAALEIKSTDKGILFPSLTTQQRDQISNPPNGLHIFNTDDRCLNYYDTAYKIWNCYCDTCRTVVIDIVSDNVGLNIYETYFQYSFARKIVIRIAANVTIKAYQPPGNSGGYYALTLGFPYAVSVRIINYGRIIGCSGRGGGGNSFGCTGIFPGWNGSNGGMAIAAGTNYITIENYGLIAGGGGGGGGGTSLNRVGGGGGGGAGAEENRGGPGGIEYIAGDFNCTIVEQGQPGTAGTLLLPGIGGAPSSGPTGNAYGGNGGALGQAGFAGLGAGPVGQGGLPGKAVLGTPGRITIINMPGGQILGAVD